MANTATRKSAKTADVKEKQPAAPAVKAEPQKVEPEHITAINIDPEQYVVVRNGFQGKLIYRSPRTNEKFVWPNFGDEQEMTLRELKNARGSRKGFFQNNWFMFDEDWIIDYLGVGQYYKHALRMDEFDTVFKKTPDEIEHIVRDLSKGQKNAIAYRARTLISEGVIDSRKVIAALERALGTSLIEK